jgi:hypothetical protein
MIHHGWSRRFIFGLAAHREWVVIPKAQHAMKLSPRPWVGLYQNPRLAPVPFKLRHYRSGTYFAVRRETYGMPAVGRFCCKTPKLPGANFLAITRSDLKPPMCVVSISLGRSPVSLSSGDEAPHIFTRKSRLRPGKFLITGAKRVLQQNLPQPDVSNCRKNSLTIRSPRRHAAAVTLAY